MLAIIGAAGKVGAATLAALRKTGRPVRAIIHQRTPPIRPGEDLQLVRADLLDPRSTAAALDGASAVQVILPLTPATPDLRATAAALVAALADALGEARPERILAISDYGAQNASGAGMASLFHPFEARLRELPGQLTLLRSAEQMQNWARALPLARSRGDFPTLRAPLDRPFPTVAAQDVGAVAATLLQEPGPVPRLVHVEGPRRYSALDVAAALGVASGRAVLARALPREAWEPMLVSAGMSPATAAIMAELNAAVNAGLADAEPGFEVRLGGTPLTTVLQATPG